MAGLIAISMEKYATRPEAGNESYENGLDDVGIATIISATLPSCEAANRGLKNSEPATGQYGSCPVFIGLKPSQFSKCLLERKWKSADGKQAGRFHSGPESLNSSQHGTKAGLHSPEEGKSAPLVKTQISKGSIRKNCASHCRERAALTGFWSRIVPCTNGTRANAKRTCGSTGSISGPHIWFMKIRRRSLTGSNPNQRRDSSTLRWWN